MKVTKIIAEPGRLDFIIQRNFDASKDLVFKAFTDPELLCQWFMPREANLQVVYMNCRAGGSYHLTQNGPGGGTFGFKGVYHEVSPEAGIMKTAEFLGLPQRILPLLEITTFEEVAHDQTTVKIHSICTDSNYRDAMISAGMQPTLNITHTLLDSLLDQLKV